MFWPTGHVETLLGKDVGIFEAVLLTVSVEVLIDMKQPFLLASGGMFNDRVSPEIIKQANDSGVGMFHSGQSDDVPLSCERSC
jgi:hypothetical protein